MSTFKWETHFKDTGCQVSPKCQTCPLPKCKHEMTKGESSRLKGWSRRNRALEVYRRLRDADPRRSNREAALLAGAEVGVTARTVQRALAAARAAGQMV